MCEKVGVAIEAVMKGAHNPLWCMTPLLLPNPKPIDPF